MYQSILRVIGNYYYRYGKKTALKLFTALVIAAMLLPNATPAFAAAYDATKEALQRANPQPAEMESVNWPDTTHSAAQRAPGVESLGIPKPTATPLPGTAIAPQATPVDGSAPESRLLYNPTLNMAETTSEAETSSAAKPPTKRVITDPIALQFLQRVPLAESTFNLTARYPAIYAGHNTSIFYELPTWESLEAGLGKDDTLVLAIQVPEGFSPLIYIYSTWDHENRILYVTPDKARGILRFSVAKDTQGPWTFQGALVLNETELDTSELTLEEKGVFSIDAAGGNATHDDLGITVEFSEKALPEGLELRIRPVFAWADAYASSPSGNPFEILAEGLTSDSAVTTFPDYFTITLVYDEGWLWGDEKDLVMKYYNDETGRWVALPSVVDTEANTITAWSNHLTSLDFSIDNYQAATLPTLEPFQVSQFTGAGTYSFPIEVPAGPGGLQPSLSLSYNSQMVDDSTYQHQASWVGMGWSLDTGYIERISLGDDVTDASDDTYVLTMNGVGGTLIRDDDTWLYYTSDESFWTLHKSGSNWIVYDTMGNIYTFGYEADMVVYDYPTNCSNVDVQVLTWRWYLTSIENIHGKKLTYTYTSVEDLRTDKCGNNPRYMDRAVYPEYIYYPGYVSGTSSTYTYRIKFTLAASDTDHDDDDWPGDKSPVHYRTKHLDDLEIHYYNHATSIWDKVRYYDFSYATTSGHVYPNYVWPAGGKTLTLTSVKEYAKNATGYDYLPASTFTYGDYLHLTQVENGYGGKVVFTYTKWFEDDVPAVNGRILYKYYNSTYPCNEDTHGWTGYGTGDTVECDDTTNRLYLDGEAYRNVPEGFVGFGNVFYFQIQAQSYPNSTGSGQVGIDYNDQNVVTLEFDTTTSLATFSGYVTAPGNSTDARFYIECDGCRITEWKVVRLATKYRVTEKKVYPNNDSNYAIYTYTYDDATTDDNNNVVFLGNGMAVAEAPEGAVISTYYYQGGDRKGRVSVVITHTQENEEFFDGKELTDLSSSWTLTGDTGEHGIERSGGDDALKTYNSNSDWNTTVERSSNTISDGEMMLVHFFVPSTGSGQSRLLVSSTSGSFGIALRSGTYNKYIQAYYSGSYGDVLISEQDFLPGKWYVMMIVVDDDDDFLVRVWQAGAPTNAGEYICNSSCSMTSSLNWKFEQSVYNGTIFLDSYREGTLYSTTQTEYGVLDTEIDHCRTNNCTTWVYPTTTTTRTFEADATWTGTRVEYEYNTSDQGGSDSSTQFGNLTRILDLYWDNSTSQWKYYRATVTNFYPEENLVSGIYLVGFPARVTTYKCNDSTTGCTFTEANRLSETRYIYDTNTGYDDKPDDGKLSKVRTRVNSNDFIQVAFGYDAWGNPTTLTNYSDYWTSTTNPTDSRVTTTTYDSTYHTYPITITDPLGFQTTLGYDYSKGVSTSMQDPNGVTTTSVYDSFGRMVKIVAPGDSSGSPTMEVVFNDVNKSSTVYPFVIDLRQKVDTLTTYRIVKFYDGAGLLLQVQTLGEKTDGQTIDYGVVTSDGTKFVVVDFDYDDLGRLVKQSIPYAIDTYDVATNGPTKQAPNWTSNPYTARAYDSVGRLSTITATNDVPTTYTYDQVEESSKLFNRINITEILIIDTTNTTRTTTSTYDEWGRVGKVTPPTGPDMRYTYDELDRLTAVKKGNDSNFETTLTYDNAGRKTEMEDPDIGHWYYTYNGLGNLTIQRDAKDQRICLYYDDNNRLIGKHYRNNDSCPSSPPLGDLDVAYVYDSTLDSNYGIGHMTAMYDPSGYTTWKYDSRGRVTEETKYIVGEGAYTIGYSYNSGDLITSIDYPNVEDTTETVNFTYHPQMVLDSVIGDETYIASTDYDATGRTVERVYGDVLDNEDPVEVVYTYYAWDTSESGNSLGRLKTLTAGPGSDPDAYQDLEYEFDLVGNVTKIFDRRDTDNLYETQEFEYDTLDRLTDASADNDDNQWEYDETYVYDTQGRLEEKAGTDLNYSNTNNPHAVLGLDTSTTDYGYDANGNMTSRPWDGSTQTLTYDYENRVVGFSGDAPYTSANTFWDGFETNDLTGWDSSAIDGGDLDTSDDCPTTDFAPEGSYCLAATIDDNNQIYVEDQTPSNENDWHVRFLFDPNGLTMSSGDYHDIFQMLDGTTTAVKLQLRWNGSNYQIKLRVNDDGGSGNTVGWYTISDDVHDIVIEWWQDSDGGADTGADTGQARLYIDGELKGTINEVDNDSHYIDKTRLGATQGLDYPDTYGTVYFDAFTSWSEAKGMIYDGSGQRVKTVINGYTTIYIAGIYERDMVNQEEKSYYQGAMREGEYESEVWAEDVYWMLSDPLGSISLIVDTNGSSYSTYGEKRYKAWGEERYSSGTIPTTMSYTGQRNEADIGLMFYNARWYDPTIGRFAQADNLVVHIFDARENDRYAYVENNPIKYTDSSGHSAESPCELLPAECGVEVDDGEYNSPYGPFNPMPISGSELNFQESADNYNDGRTATGNFNPNERYERLQTEITMQESANCYEYILGPLSPEYLNNDNAHWIQPGQIANPLSELNSDANNISAYISRIINGAKADAVALGYDFFEWCSNEPCPAGTYKVALVVDKDQFAYDWLRQDDDGSWSHKDGAGPAENTDDDGKRIWDPRTANLGRYNHFVGYFCIGNLTSAAQNGAQ